MHLIRLVLLLLAALSPDITFGNLQALELVNSVRSKHNAQPVQWVSFLEDSATRWAKELANKNKFEHSTSIYGENIAGTYSNSPLSDAIKMWYSEETIYDYSKPGFSFDTGHFTQLVWNSTREIGAGVSKMSNGMWVIVMQYNPPGNYAGQYEKNVFRPAIFSDNPPTYKTDLPPSPSQPSPPSSSPPIKIPLSAEQRTLALKTMLAATILCMTLIM